MRDEKSRYTICQEIVRSIGQIVQIVSNKFSKLRLVITSTAYSHVGTGQEKLFDHFG